MITFESIMSIDKNALPEAAKTLSSGDITQLVEWLALKDDNIRYQAFKLLQYRSTSFGDVYPHWNVFRNKLSSDNSYQRSNAIISNVQNLLFSIRSEEIHRSPEHIGCRTYVPKRKQR